MNIAEKIKGKAIGFYLSLGTSLLLLISLIIYLTLRNTISGVTLCLVFALICSLLPSILSLVIPNERVLLLEVPTAVLTTISVIWSLFSWIDQLGYVVAGLDPFSTVAGYIAFVIFGIIALILSIVTSFCSIEKEVKA